MRLIRTLILSDFFEASMIVVVFPVPDISKQIAHVGLSPGPLAGAFPYKQSNFE